MSETQNTILIVDDDPAIAGLISLNLQQANFNLLVAYHADEGLAIVEKTIPDLILLDIMMPDIDGIEFARRLKTNDRTKFIPIIFITARSKTIDKVKGLEVGAVDYMIKPFENAELLARVKTHLTISKLQRDLEQQIRDRDDLIAELDAFTRTVAHDLKNPIASTMGYAQMLLQLHQAGLNKPDHTLNSLEKIEQLGRKMVNIVDELLLLATVRREEIQLSPIEMDTILEQVIERLSFMMEEYKPDIAQVDEWPLVMGYGPWVEEIWANYISNALKYGGNPPQIAFGFDELSDNKIQFWIQDNGTGLSMAQQQSLFTEFSRLHDVSIEGHGLGLSIVARIANRLGSQVGVESEVGAGSKFYFTLNKVIE